MNARGQGMNRTAKIFLDSGAAESVEAAESRLQDFVVQIAVGSDIGANRTRQALLLTAVNVAARSFLGGVRVFLEEDAVTSVGWDAGLPLSRVVERLGGIVVHALSGDVPTICVGDCDTNVVGDPVIRATFDGWVGAAVEGQASPLAERDWFVPAGVFAAGVAVGEVFEHQRGDVRAARRQQGMSLWLPGADWLAGQGVGNRVEVAPSRVWVIGLGHLGQAYLWTLGLVPYGDAGQVSLLVQDDDRIGRENESTGLLTPPVSWRGEMKTRAVAQRLQERGFSVRISERRFRKGQGPGGEEPTLALVGVDNRPTRAELSGAGFEFVIDAGLGGGSLHYRDIMLHMFPGGQRSDEVPGWRASSGGVDEELLGLPAYRKMMAETNDECGVVEVAGRSVAAPFVGASAAAMVVAEATRYLQDEHRLAIWDASLRDLGGVQAVEASGVAPAGNPGFARLEVR